MGLLEVWIVEVLNPKGETIKRRVFNNEEAADRYEADQRAFAWATGNTVHAWRM